MKRRNVQLAFIGEGSAPTADLDSLVDGDEAVEVEIRSGQLTVVVVPGTPDDRIFEEPTREPRCRQAPVGEEYGEVQETMQRYEPSGRAIGQAAGSPLR